jgi:hypothetical protein
MQITQGGITVPIAPAVIKTILALSVQPSFPARHRKTEANPGAKSP